MEFYESFSLERKRQTVKCVRISGGHDVRGGLRALREIRLERPDLV